MALWAQSFRGWGDRSRGHEWGHGQKTPSGPFLSYQTGQGFGGSQMAKPFQANGPPFIIHLVGSCVSCHF